MDSFARMENDLRPIKLSDNDELKISAIMKALKEFTTQKLDRLVNKDKLPKASADFLKKLYFNEIESCKMDIKHAFIVSSGMVYPLLKSLGNCILRAISVNDRRLMLVEALAVFEENVNIYFQGGEITRDFIDIMNQSAEDKLDPRFGFRTNVATGKFARELEGEDLTNLKDKSKLN